jgi:dephospho-CoA kinase
MTDLVIGLTGGIGSGKSTVAQMMRMKGARVIDVDEIGRNVLLPDTRTFQQILNYFGNTILQQDGIINRQRLGDIVFSNPRELEVLERISHPAINTTLKMLIRKESSPVVILDMAVLVEKPLAYDGSTPLYDRVIVVESLIQTRIERLKLRGLTPEEIDTRIASQASDEERREVADRIIVNDGSIHDLINTVDVTWTLVENWLASLTSGCIGVERKT